MSLTVLGIACSPRRQGNSTYLLSEAMSTVQAAGHRSEIIHLSDLNFSACQGCGACSSDAKCVQQDDMQEFHKRLIEVDRIIIAAPIFFMGLNAQAKAMIDRSQPFWAVKYILNQPVISDTTRAKRRGLFISTAGTKKTDVFTCAQQSIRTFFHILEIEYAQACLYDGIDKAGEITKHQTARTEISLATRELLK